MDLNELQSMKYGDLVILAKEKLNITKRMTKVSYECVCFKHVNTLIIHFFENIEQTD